MGALFPEAAAHWLAQQGARLHLGERVHTLHPQQRGRGLAGQWPALCPRAAGHPQPRSGPFGAALGPGLGRHGRPTAHTAIATVYAWAAGVQLPRPMLALQGGPAQFVFDKGQLGGPAGLLALVVSANQHGRAELENLALAQAQAQLALPRLHALKTVIDKRATFACTPAVARPGQAVAPSYGPAATI